MTHAQGQARIRWVVSLGIALAALIGSPPNVVGDEETGKHVEFPFRRETGELAWVAKAERVQRLYNVMHPVAQALTDAFQFDRDPQARNASRPGETPAYGVELVLPLIQSAATAGRATRVAKVLAAVGTFYLGDELLVLRDTRVEMRASGDPLGQPTVLTTARLNIHFRMVPGFNRKLAHFTTDAAVTLSVPEQDFAIHKAVGLTLREADPRGLIRLERDVAGTIGNSPWLNLSDQFTHADTGEPLGTNFQCDGAFEIELGADFSTGPRRVLMDRAVLIRQQPGGRSLQCQRFELLLRPALVPASQRIELFSAHHQVAFNVPDAMLLRCGAVEWKSMLTADGLERQTAEFTRLEKLTIVSNADSSGSLLDLGWGGEQPPSRTRLDAYAEGKVSMVREQKPTGRPGELLGHELWSLRDYARIRRYARPATATPFRPGSVADLMAPNRTGSLGEEWVEDPREILLAVLNGSGKRTLESASGLAGGIESPLRPDPQQSPVPTPRGSIRIYFTLYDSRDPDTAGIPFPLMPSRPAPPVAAGTLPPPPSSVRRYLVSLVADNPGVQPVLEIRQPDPRLGIRFYAPRMSIGRDRNPTGEIDLAQFIGERPQVVWLTDRDPLARAAHAVRPDAIESALRGGVSTAAAANLLAPPIYRCSVQSERPFSIRQWRDSRGVIRRREADFPGDVRVRKAPHTGGGSYNPALVAELDGRDLRLGFDSRFNGRLECTFATATKPVQRPLRFTWGLDRGTCSAATYTKAPRPSTPHGSSLWEETLAMVGPLELELRDPDSTRLIPIAPSRTSTQAALVHLDVEGSATLRQQLVRSADQDQMLSREWDVWGPLRGRAFAEDTARLRADQTPNLLLEARGERGFGRTAIDLSTGIEWPRLLVLQGGASYVDQSRGLAARGQLAVYRHDPSQPGAAGLPTLTLQGEPELRIAAEQARVAGTLRVTFPPTDNPAIKAQRTLELIQRTATVFTVAVNPRSVLEWTPATGATMRLEGDVVELQLQQRRRGNWPLRLADESPRGLKDLLAPNTAFVVRSLQAVGHVVTRQGHQTAHGETLFWRLTDDDRRYGYIWGQSTGFSGVFGQSRVRFEQALANATGLQWLPGPVDPIPDAQKPSTGTLYQLQNRNPDHPERRNIVTATSHDKMRLRITLPAPQNPAAREPSSSSSTERR